MANRRSRIRPGFWIGLAFVALLAYALIADWWKDNPGLGRVIVGVVVAVFVLCLWLVRPFREWLVRTVKRAFGVLVYEPENEQELSVGSEDVRGPRKPTPPQDLTSDEKNLFIHKMGNVCENPTCGRTGILEVHHVIPRREGGKNKAWNLLVLCGSCHNEADKGIPPRPRQRQWADQHRNQRNELRRSAKWKYR